MAAVSFARRPRISSLAGAALLTLGLAACGASNNSPTRENNGVYITAGPVTYQLQVSRQLNQYSTEDRSYVSGLPPGMTNTLRANQLWYGVFLWAKNQTKRPQKTTDAIDIVDTQGNHYRPIAINPNVNPYAWSSQSLPPDGTEPAPDTTASFGPTQGALLLFKLPTSVYDNRPLTLELKGPTGRVWGSVSLDL